MRSFYPDPLHRGVDSESCAQPQTNLAVSSGTRPAVPHNPQVTPRDRVLVRALALSVRMFQLRQVADHWFFGDRANARRRLKLLCRKNFVERSAARARPLPPLAQPLIAWKPGDPVPAFGSVAHQLKKRWIDRPLRNCIIYRATRHAVAVFGGRLHDRIKAQSQITHDLGVAQVWLELARTHPDWSLAWRGEDVMAHQRRGQKLPDAFIVNAEGRTVAVVEFGGGYDRQRVQEFHQDCVMRNLPYQLW